MIKEPVKLGTGPSARRRPSHDNAFAADSLERRDLRSGFLISKPKNGG